MCDFGNNCGIKMFRSLWLKNEGEIQLLNITLPLTGSIINPKIVHIINKN